MRKLIWINHYYFCMKEIEAKLKLNNLSIINKAGLIKEKEVKVLDIYFDNDFLKLKTQDKALRLRKENKKCFIAFKGQREKHRDLLVRDEIEAEMSSFEKVLKIINNLNFKEVAKVEKIRTYFSIKKYPSLSITIDKYPFIKSFIEIEGDERDVCSFLKEFKFNFKDTIKKNCTESFLEYCKKNNLTFRHPEMHFTFKDELKYKK
jgi:predicted adenylyl cyclase CyaB